MLQTRPFKTFLNPAIIAKELAKIREVGILLAFVVNVNKP